MQKRPILVVDDDSATIEFISVTLESLGHTVISAASGDEALEQAKEHAPALIFINLAVPDTAGLKICKSLMSIVDAPLILLTLREGKFDPRYKSQYGIVAFLRKPVSAQELLEITSEHAPAPERLPAEEAESLEGAETFEIPEEGEIPSASELEASLASYSEGEETLTPVEAEELEDGAVTEVLPEEDVSGYEEAIEVVSEEKMPSEVAGIEEAEEVTELEEEVPEWTIPETEAEFDDTVEEEAPEIAPPEEEPAQDIAEEEVGEVSDREMPEEPSGDQAPAGESLPDWLIPEGGAQPWAQEEGEGLPRQGEPDWPVREEEPAEEPPVAGEEVPEWSMPEETGPSAEEEPDWGILEEEPVEEPPATEEEVPEEPAQEQPIEEEAPPMEETGASILGEETAESFEESFQGPEETDWASEGGEEDLGFNEEEDTRMYETPSPASPVEPAAPHEEKEYEIRPAALERHKRRKRKSSIILPLLLVLVIAAVAGWLVLYFVSGKGKPPVAPQKPLPPIAETEKAPIPPPEVPEAGVMPAPPVEEPAASQEPSAPAPGEKAYYVQFGAFRSRANAESMQDKLKEKGYDTIISESTSKGQPLYLVLLSDSFSDKWTAFKQARQIKNASGIGTAVHAE